jgi:hypothetical protein
MLRGALKVPILINGINGHQERRQQSIPKLTLYFVLATLAAASMWMYVDRILIAHQVVDAVANDRPRGNLSDLYPRWLGARELLLRHRNPYSDEITLEIQKGYYGRPLDPNRPNDPKDQQAFAYPVYVVLLLAPLIDLPFHAVKFFFYWFLVAVTIASIWLWLRVVHWRLHAISVATCIVLTFGSFQSVQALKLQQLTLLVAVLLAGSAAAIASGFLFGGGCLLALATIKPQIAWPLAAWLLFWAVTDWRRRRRLVFGFVTVMAFLLAGAEIVLPGWLRMFRQAIENYHRYTQSRSVLDVMVPWASAGKILAVLATLVCIWLLVKFRNEAAGTEKFGRITALIMGLTVLIVPMFAPYNQVLLLPTIFVLARDQTSLVSRSRSTRFLYIAGAFSLCWQWLASLALCAIFAVSPPLALEGWQWPYYASATVPILVFALIFIDLSADHSTVTQS